MSGPIVRTGTTPKFWTNWDKAFGGQEEDKNSKANKKKAPKAAKAAKKKAAKKKLKK